MSLLSMLAVAVLFGLGPWVGSAHADVWGYIDARGTAHFASEKIDERYELYYKGTGDWDASIGGPAPSTHDGASAAAYPRAVAVPTRQSRLVAFFEVSPAFKSVRHHLREAATTHGIDMELLQALIVTESGFDAFAVSPKGAVGLMQLMPATAQRYGVRGEPHAPLRKKLTDPRINIQAGAHYLRDLIHMFPGRLDLALAAYNAGEGAVQRHGHQIPPYRETQNYVATVLQIYHQIKPPTRSAVARSSAPQPSERAQTPLQRTPVPAGISGRSNMVPPLQTGTEPSALHRF